MSVENRGRRMGVLAGIILAGALTPAAFAQTITVAPDTKDLTLNPGDSACEPFVVTVPAETVTAKADVYLLADTTGSMGTILSAVKAGASSVVDGLIASLPGTDLWFGVGNYKDFPYDVYCFDHQSSLSASAAAAKAAIATWAASGGADGPEGQLFALDRLASNVDPAGGTIGWRPDAEKIIVWFGDWPGHDPVCPAISGLAFSITEGSTTTKLQTANLHVVAISTNTGAGLDYDPRPYSSDYNAYCGTPGGAAGQATRLSTTTGGAFQNGVNASQIVATIVTLVEAQVQELENLRLAAHGAIVPFVASIDPATGYGPIDTSDESVWSFEVCFSGTEACGANAKVFVDTLDVLADGAVTDQVDVTITVPACDGACVDTDGDGYGSPGDPSCPGGEAPDCDDGDPAVFPGAEEICNGIDDDCDTLTDEDLPGCDQAIVLDSLSAETFANGVMVRWRTLAETDNAGFRVLRQDTPSGSATVVSGIIPARGSALAGAEYEFFDQAVPRRARVLTFWLEDIDLRGQVTRHGPVTVQMGTRRIVKTTPMIDRRAD